MTDRTKSDISKPSVTYVAIKFLTVHQTMRVELEDSLEVQAFEKIQSANPSHPGFKHCLTLKEYFPLQSAAGHHLCLVTDALSSNLYSLGFERKERTYPLHLTKHITKQVLLALDYIHRECGWIHAGKHHS
jgi:serine/threonine-protein kinase SRPK3